MKLTALLFTSACLIALLSITAPATATATATADTSSASTTNRLEGPFQTESTLGAGDRTNWVPNPSTGQIDSAATPSIWSFPTVGATGPIRAEDLGLCLTVPANVTDPLVLLPCNGASAQQFTVPADGRLVAVNGMYVTDFPAPGNGHLTATLNINSADALWFDVLSSVTTVEPVTITSPADNDVTLRNPEFKGNGDDGAQITVHDAAGTELCRDTVAAGSWSCTTTINLPDGPVDADATQVATDTSVSVDDVSFVVADPLNSPVINPLIAAGTGALVAAAGAIVYVRRKRSDH